MPALQGMYNVPAQKPKVWFYEGKEGIKKVYEKLLLEKGPIYAFSDYEKMMRTMESDYMWEFPQKRTKKKIKFYCIAKDGPIGKKVKSLDAQQFRETKLVKEVEFETEINISDDKVFLISFKEPGAGVIIEDIAIANTQKSIWQMLWKNLK
jgi:hypothetical protein